MLPIIAWRFKQYYSNLLHLFQANDNLKSFVIISTRCVCGLGFCRVFQFVFRVVVWGDVTKILIAHSVCPESQAGSCDVKGSKWSWVSDHNSSNDVMWNSFHWETCLFLMYSVLSERMLFIIFCELLCSSSALRVISHFKAKGFYTWLLKCLDNVHLMLLTSFNCN